MAGPWENYAATTAPAAPAGPWTAYAAPRPTAIERAVEPITSFVPTEQRMAREAASKVSEGAQQASSAIMAAPAEPRMDPSGRWDASRGGSLVDALSGAGKAAMGAVDYALAPVNAALKTVAGKPIEENFGIPAPVTEFALSLALPMPKKLPMPASRDVTPSTEAIKEAATRTYDDVTKAGNLTPVHSSSFEQTADRMKTALDKSGLRASVAPRTHAAIEEIRVAMGNPTPDITELVAAKRTLKELAGSVDKVERKAATGSMRYIDRKIDELAPDIAKQIKEADKNYSSAMTAGSYEKAIEKAETRAAKSGTGGNLDNTIRQEVDRVTQKARGLTAEEVAQAGRVVEGTKARNALRMIGRLDPTSGGLPALLHVGAATASGGMTAPIAAVGFAGRKLAEKLTERDAQKLVEMIQARSPHAGRVMKPMNDWGKAAQAVEIDPNLRNMAKFAIASRNLSNNLADIEIALDPRELLSMLSRPSEGGNEQR
jgi:hypothetical protein